MEKSHQAHNPVGFKEIVWDIKALVVDGMNRVTITMDEGSFALLGVKVATTETLIDEDHYQNIQFVNKCFQEFHSRFPTEEELELYVGMLDSGEKTQEQVRELIKKIGDDGTDQHDKNVKFVIRAFKKYLGYEPEEKELEFYVKLLDENTNTKPEVEALIQADHYQNRVYVIKAFKKIHDTKPTDEQLSYYVRLLDSKEATKPRVIELITVKHFENMQFVITTFQEIHGKEPNDAQLNYYTGLLDSGTPRPKVRTQIKQSHFLNFNFVKKTYKEIHGEIPEDGILDFYVEFLDKGLKTKAEVRQMIIDKEHEWAQEHKQNVAYVNSAFMELHNAHPTKKQLDYYVALLDAHAYSKGEVREMIQVGHYSNIQMVNQLFTEITGGAPTQSQLDYYVKLLDSQQTTIDQVKVLITKHHFLNLQYVNSVFIEFSYTPSKDEVDFYVELLDNQINTNEEVKVLIQNNHYSNRKFVQSSWLEFYGELPDPTSLSFFTNLLDTKQKTREEIRKMIKDLGGGNNNEEHDANLAFVKKAFKKHLDREPTPEELKHYTALLDAGTYAKAEVDEMIKKLSGQNDGDMYDKLVYEYFQTYLGRPPTPTEKQFYASKLRSNQMTLAQFKQELENMASNTPEAVTKRIRNTFFQVLGRYPSAQELEYYRNKIQKGELTWKQFENEVHILQGQGQGEGFSLSDVQNMDFSKVSFDDAFFAKLSKTGKNILSGLLKRAKFEEMHSNDERIIKGCRKIIREIKKLFPELVD